uniref:Uncharacterized protein n=1 Tax=Caenorhabditis tropicalis TaxID=1561998 RepID=A0A1I7TJM8_9PELO
MLPVRISSWVFQTTKKNKTRKPRKGAQLQTPNASNQHYSGENRSMRGGGDEQMKNFTEMTNEELRERLMKMQMDMQNLQMAMGGGGADGDGSNRNSANYATREEPSGRMDRRTEYESGGQRGQQEQLKQRSKSMPRSLRQLGVGKPFNVAAKQAKKEYIERRRTYSGSRDALNGRGRGTQFSEEVLSANAVKLPDNRF